MNETYFLCGMQKFKMAAKVAGKQKNVSVDSADSVRVKITLKSPTISDINAFLHFTQKFKMAAKNGGKTIYGKSRQ